MQQALYEVLNGREGNYLLPFYWQHGDHYEKIPEQIERIYQSGARALCVESRPHPDFCGPNWWRDMDLILDECRKRDMKVWILDDNHFPTGNAVGAVRNHPELHRSQLVYETVDVMGSASAVQFLLPRLDADENLLRVVAFRRTDAPYDLAGNFTDGEQITGEPVDLTGNVRGKWLFWDVPEGCWRIFYLIVSPRRGVSPGKEWYIDMLNPESCRLLIDTVYEPHYARYGELFGTTLMGFFSDEPGWGNCLDRAHTRTIDPDLYFYKIGLPGMGLPWSNDVLEEMSAALHEDAACWLPLLWYRDQNRFSEVRYVYMDVITRAYQKNFTLQIGDWCRAHNVLYIGHIIEDVNASGRLGYGPGHYFRSLHGQDMAGIDIVLHQIMPGMAHYDSSFPCAWSASNARFFHYVLGKLGGSMAHLDPLARGRGMCEVFGAYGWSEGVPTMKWLIDYLLVRGINWFVPHAFSPEFPDPDCPPHMGADGRDPQFGAFRELMLYTNRVAHLLSDGAHQATAALLYHAEAEWMNYVCMMTEEPACALYDRQIDYDIVSADMLEDAGVENGKLCIASEKFEVLIVPQAKLIPDALAKRLRELAKAGVRVWFAGGAPENLPDAEVVPLERLAEACRPFSPVRTDKPFDFLRVYHYKRGTADYYMLVNESTEEVCDLRLTLPSRGGYLSLDLLGGGHTRGVSDGTVSVRLAPYESRVLAFGAVSDEELAAFPEAPVFSQREPLEAEWTIERANWETPGVFEPVQVSRVLPNLTGPDGDPDFSGFVRYRAFFDAGDLPPVCIDLGKVGQTVRMTLNGADVGWRIAPPYRFDVSKVARPGKNELELLVANTLGNALADPLSFYMPIQPTGLLGPVELMR